MGENYKKFLPGIIFSFHVGFEICATLFPFPLLNGCHDLLMMSVNLDIAIFSINNVDYRCIINEISKSDALNLLQNADLIKERGVL